MLSNKSKKTELVELLLNYASNDNFAKRFQSFLDQIPKPGGGSSAIGKEGFFVNFFLGMFASLNNVNLELGLKDLRFKLVGNDLHVMVKIQQKGINQGNSYDKLFIFSENRSGKPESSHVLGNEANENSGTRATKILIGKEDVGGGRWKHKIFLRHYEGNAPSFDGFERCMPHGSKLENDVNTLAKGNPRTSKNAAKNIIDCIAKVYSEADKKGVVVNNGTEAAQHGFISGMLMNFRYRCNLRLYLELLTGRGYSDIVLLVRGIERARRAIPVVIELKTGLGTDKDKNNLNVARSQAKSYATGISPDKMRMYTLTRDVIYMGANLAGVGKCYTVPESIQIERNEVPLIQSLSDTSIGVSEQVADDIAWMLSRVYYTFPPEQYVGNYLSRFLFGQLPLFNIIRGKKVERYVLLHDNPDNFYITTFIFIIREDQCKSKVLVFHVQEKPAGVAGLVLDDKDFSEYDGITIRSLKLFKKETGLNNSDEVIQVCLKGYQFERMDKSEHKKYSPGTYYSYNKCVTLSIPGAYTVENYFSVTAAGRKLFKGRFYCINDTLQEFQDHFKKAIDYQLDQEKLRKQIVETQDRNRSKRVEVDLGDYDGLFRVINRFVCIHKQIFDRLILNENEFKAFLDGLLTGLGNLDKDRIVSVLTEFQIGGGGRADMMVQVVDASSRDSVSVGFELKYGNLLEQAERDIKRDLDENASIKSITDGDKAAFIGITFNKNDSDKPITTSNKFFAADVVHSSLDSGVVVSAARSRVIGS